MKKFRDRIIESIVQHPYGTALFLGIFIYNLFLLLPNGIHECVRGICGLSMVDTYFHDSFYHIALASTAFQTVPFQMPIFSSALMQGYHYLYDLLLYLLSFSGLSLVTLYWRISPLVYLGGMSWLLVRYARTVHRSSAFLFLLLFLFFFGGTASYIATIRNSGSPFGDGVSSLLHTSTLILYPTVGFSLILFGAIFIILMDRRESRRRTIVIGLLLFLSMGMKFYAGLLLILMIGIIELYTGWKETHYKRTGLRLGMYAFCFFAALVVFYRFPQALGTEPVFSYAPFATVHPVFEDSHIYRTESLIHARQTLEKVGLGPRLVVIEALAATLYLFHHYGTRLLGLGYLFWLIGKRKATIVDVSSTVVIIAATGASMVLVQRGDQWWNSMQFLYYSAFLLTLYTARWLYRLTEYKEKWAVALVVLVCVLSIPDSIEKMSELYKTPKRIVSAEEVSALSFLRRQSKGVVFSVPSLPDTAYISALSHKVVYYADEQMLRNNGIDYQARKTQLLKPEDLDLNSVNAQYVYLVKKDPEFVLIHRKAKDTSFREIYENKEVIIMKRDR